MNPNEYIKRSGLTGKQAKAYRRFDRLCKDASQCREQRRQVSCFSCPAYNSCQIQKAQDAARKIYQS